MKLKHITMRLMVLNMRWLTRYFSFIARPLVAMYASKKIIACGLKSENGDVSIIYTPPSNHLDYSFFKKEKRALKKVKVIAAKYFSRNLVHRVVLSNTEPNEVYIVRTRRGDKGKILRSPDITIKEKTFFLPSLLKIDQLLGGKVRISWEKGESYNPMIYFLAVENNSGKALTGIYTREHFWEYPRIKKASLTIGDTNPPLLQRNKQYVAKLVIIDFDGWAICIGKKTFRYSF